MWDRDETTRKLREASLSGGPWGDRGPEALERIEHGLGAKLGHQLRQFVLNVGNLRIDPFNIIVAGDEAGTLSALTETHPVWERNPALQARKDVQVMAHAGEVYLYYPENEHVAAYDALRPVAREETLSWESLKLFLDWVVTEAEAAMNDPRYPLTS